MKITMCFIIILLLNIDQKAQPFLNFYEINSLEQCLEQATSDSLRISILTNLALGYKNINPYKSKVFCDSAINTFYKINYELQAQHIFKLAQAYNLRGDIHSAKNYLYQIIRIEKDIKNSKINILALIELGNLNLRNTKNDSALIYFIEAEHKLHELKKCSELPEIYFSLAKFYNEQNNTQKADSFFTQAIQMSISNGNKQFPAIIKLRQTKIAIDKNEMANAELLLNDLLNTITKDIELLEPEIYFTIGLLEKKKNNYNLAVENLHKAINKAKALNIDWYLWKYYMELTNIYISQNNYDSAFYYSEFMLQFAQKNRMYNEAHYSYVKISSLYENRNEFKKGLELLKISKLYYDSIIMNDTRLEIARKEALYATKAKFHDLSILKKEQDIKEAKSRLIQTIVFILIFAIVLIIAILSYILQQKKIRSKQRISVLMSQNLRQQMNPHFVFNTLNSIQYFLFQNDKNLSNIYLSKFAHLLRLVIDNSEKQYIPLSIEIEALKLYLELEKLRFKERIEYLIHVEDKIDIEKIEIPPMLIQPYVENAILHGLIPLEKKGMLSIDIRQKENKIYAVITDNGIGREKSEELKKGRNRNHQSLGSKITENRINLLNAIHKNNLKITYSDLTDQNGNPAGTKVELTIPLKRRNKNEQTI